MNIKNIFTKLDLFSSTDFLKINRQSSYKTKTGGVFTLMFIAVIILIFVMRIDSRSRGQRMVFKSETMFNNNEPATLNTSPSSNNHFMLGVLITNDFNFQGYGLRDFNVSITLVTETSDANDNLILNYNQNYNLQPCTADHWKASPQTQIYYKQNYSSFNYLCLPMDKIILLQQSTVIRHYSQITIQVCKAQTCKSYQQISEYFNYGKFRAQIIFINSYIFTTNINYKVYYIQRIKGMTFTSKTNSQVNLQFSKYDVTTDRNYFIPIPQNQILRQQGAFLKQKSDPILKKTQWIQNELYLKIILGRLQQKIILLRVDQRLIDIISYIGGLAATIYSVFQLIASYYSCYAFEIEISHKIFKDSTQDIRQQKQDEKTIQTKPTVNYVTNFYQYMKNKICCCFKQSQKNNYYRKEFDKLIDIELIIHKLIIFQKIITKIAMKELNNLKQVQKDYTFEEANYFRNYLSLFFKSQADNNKSQKWHENSQKPPSTVDLYQGPLEINLNSCNQQNLSQDSRKNNGYNYSDDNKNKYKFQKQSQINNDILHSDKMINHKKDEYLKQLK